MGKRSISFYRIVKQFILSILSFYIVLYFFDLSLKQKKRNKNVISGYYSKSLAHVQDKYNHMMIAVRLDRGQLQNFERYAKNSYQK